MNFIYEVRESNYDFSSLKIFVYNVRGIIGYIKLGYSNDINSKLKYIIQFDSSNTTHPFSLLLGTDYANICVLRDFSYDEILAYLSTIEALLRYSCISNRIAMSINIPQLKYLKRQYSRMPLPRLCRHGQI